MKPGTFTINFFSALFVLGVFAFTFNEERNQQDLMKSMNAMIERMHTIEATQNFDRDFSEVMAEHHQGAIDMTAQLLKIAEDEKLIAMANKSMEMLEEKMKQLREFASKNKALKDSAGRNKDLMMEPVKKVMGEMRMMKISGETQNDYATMLIAHHRSGIEMLALEIAKGKNRKLIELSQKIIDWKNNEIRNLQDWLDNRSEDN